MKTIRTMQSGPTITTIERGSGRYAYRVSATDHRIPHRHNDGMHVHTWQAALKAAAECAERTRALGDCCEEAQRANGVIE